MGAMRQEFVTDAFSIFYDTSVIGPSLAVRDLKFKYPIKWDGILYDEVFVNYYANVSFGEGYKFGGAWRQWADHRDSLKIFHAYSDLLEAAEKGDVTIKWGYVDGHRAFAANYIDFPASDTSVTPGENQFQIMIIERDDIAPGDFDFEFNYDQVEWDGPSNTPSSYDTVLIGYCTTSGKFEQYWPAWGVWWEEYTPPPEFRLVDSNTNYGLIHNKRNSDVNGRYVWNVRKGIPQSDIEIYQTGGADTNWIFTLTHKFLWGDLYPESEYTYTYRWEVMEEQTYDPPTGATYPLDLPYLTIDARQQDEVQWHDYNFFHVQLVITVDNGVDAPKYFNNGISFYWQSLTLDPADDLEGWLWYNYECGLTLRKSTVNKTEYYSDYEDVYFYLKTVEFPEALEIDSQEVEKCSEIEVLVAPSYVTLERFTPFDSGRFNTNARQSVITPENLIVKFNLLGWGWYNYPIDLTLIFGTVIPPPEDPLCDAVSTIREAHKTEFLTSLNDTSYKGVAVIPSTPISPTLGINIGPIPVPTVDESGNCICPPVVEFIERTREE